MVFFHRGQTVGQLVQALFQVLYEPESRRNRIWLLSSELCSIMAYCVCFWLIKKKKSLGNIWLFARRATPSGRYYLANSVLVLSVGVATYLVVWDLTALVIAGFSFAGRSTYEWWWTIPLPWWPLIMGVYVSGHGFTLACSPRSPLASGGGPALPKSRKRWIYLPLPKSPAVLNTSLILPGVLFTMTTLALTAVACRAFFRARESAELLIPAEIMFQVTRSIAPPIRFEGEEMLASDELIWAARRVAAAYMEVHRYVCIHLLVYAGTAYLLELPTLLFGIPNLVSLVDHACSRHPQPLPPSCKGFLRKVFWLITKGKPKSENSTTHLNLATYKMTVMALIYVFMLATIVPAFGVVPIYIVAASFPAEVYKGNISPSICIATIAVSIITILSCTSITTFCTVATLDPLFRAAIGLNVIRNQVPIDIKVVQHQSHHEDHVSQFDMPEIEQGHDHSVVLKPSVGTFKSVKSPDSSAEYENVDDFEIDVSTGDIEAGGQLDSSPSFRR